MQGVDQVNCLLLLFWVKFLKLSFDSCKYGIDQIEA